MLTSGRAAAAEFDEPRKSDETGTEYASGRAPRACHETRFPAAPPPPIGSCTSPAPSAPRSFSAASERRRRRKHFFPSMCHDADRSPSLALLHGAREVPRRCVQVALSPRKANALLAPVSINDFPEFAVKRRPPGTAASAAAAAAKRASLLPVGKINTNAFSYMRLSVFPPTGIAVQRSRFSSASFFLEDHRYRSQPPITWTSSTGTVARPIARCTLVLLSRIILYEERTYAPTKAYISIASGFGSRVRSARVAHRKKFASASSLLSPPSPSPRGTLVGEDQS